MSDERREPPGTASGASAGIGCRCEAVSDDGSLRMRVTRFLSERDCSSVTGIRRMGREAFVDYVLSVARGNGVDATLYPDTTGGTVLFYTLDSARAETDRIAGARPSADILFGQDLCHQVPAVVRYRKGRSDVVRAGDRHGRDVHRRRHS